MKNTLLALSIFVTSSMTTYSYAENASQVQDTIARNKQILDKYIEEKIPNNNEFDELAKMWFANLFETMLNKVENESTRDEVSSFYFNFEKAEDSFRAKFSSDEIAAYNTLYIQAKDLRDKFQNELIPAYKKHYDSAAQQLLTNTTLDEMSVEFLIFRELGRLMGEGYSFIDEINTADDAFQKREKQFFMTMKKVANTLNAGEKILSEIQNSKDSALTLEWTSWTSKHPSPPLKKGIRFKRGKITEENKTMNSCFLSFKQVSHKLKTKENKPATYAIQINSMEFENSFYTIIQFLNSEIFEKLECHSESKLTVGGLNKILGRYFRLTYLESQS